MVNNFPQIRSLLSFPTNESFYFLEIIKRRKENPEMERHQKLIKDFYIYSLKEFDELEGKVIELCEENNARAYFRLNGREGKQIALQYLKRISELLITEDYRAIPRSYASVVGEFCRKEGKTWLLDLDKPSDDEEGLLELVLDWGILQTYLENRDVFVTSIDTKNGVHLIAKPFRVDEFSKWLSEAGLKCFDMKGLHKDNPTILYVP